MIRLIPFLLAAPAFAQSAPPMSTSDCRDSFALLTAATQAAPTFSRAPSLKSDGWCAASGVSINTDSTVEVRAQELRWRIGGFDRLQAGLPPTAISLTASGVRYVPRVDDAVMNYLFDVQFDQNDMMIDVDAFWDQSKNTVSLARARVVFDDDNSVSASGLVRDIDLSDLTTLQLSVGQLAVTDVSLTVQSNGLFENFLAMPLGMAVLDGSEDPQADVDKMKSSGQQILADIPNDILDENSATALGAVIADMPHPSGTLSLHLQSEQGLGAMRLMPMAMMWSGDDLAAIWDVMEDLTISATYNRSAQ